MDWESCEHISVPKSKALIFLDQAGPFLWLCGPDISIYEAVPPGLGLAPDCYLEWL